MEAITMIKERRSVRKYTNEKVDHNLITEIVDISRWAPTWANTQTARYTVIDNPQTIARIADEGVKGFAYNIGTLRDCKTAVVLSFVKGMSGHMGKSTGADADIWGVFDAGIACQTFCLTAHEKGIGTCIMGVISQDSIAKIVGLPENEEVAALITCGYPAETPHPTKREDVSSYIRFEE